MDWGERILIALFVSVASIGSSIVVFNALSSRLDTIEAATYSAQQPLERNYFADAGNAVISFKCGDTVHLFGFRVTAK